MQNLISCQRRWLFKYRALVSFNLPFLNWLIWSCCWRLNCLGHLWVFCTEDIRILVRLSCALFCQWLILEYFFSVFVSLFIFLVLNETKSLRFESVCIPYCGRWWRYMSADHLKYLMVSNSETRKLYLYALNDKFDASVDTITCLAFF